MSLPSAPTSLWTNPVGVIQVGFTLEHAIPRREPSPDAPSTQGIYLRLEGRIYGPLQQEEVEGLMGSGLLTGYEVVSRDLSAWTPLAYHPRMIATRGSDVDTAHSLLSQYSHLPVASDRPVDTTEALFEEISSDAGAPDPDGSQILRKPNMLVRVSAPDEALDIQNPNDSPGNYGDLVAHLQERKSTDTPDPDANRTSDSGTAQDTGETPSMGTAAPDSNDRTPPRATQAPKSAKPSGDRAILRRIRRPDLELAPRDADESPALELDESASKGDALQLDDTRGAKGLTTAGPDSPTPDDPDGRHDVDTAKASDSDDGAETATGEGVDDATPEEARNVAPSAKAPRSRKARLLVALFLLLVLSGAIGVLAWLELLPLP